MNNYYTPKITEFRVGFQYEYSDLDHDLKTEKWFEEIVPTIFSSSYYLDCLRHQDWIRVKYLTSEDIISKGFHNDMSKNKRMDGNFNGTFHNKKFRLRYEPFGVKGEFNSAALTIIEKRIDTSGLVKYEKVFEGKIKNISELEVVMEQLGIV